MSKNIVTLYLDDTSVRLLVTSGKRVKNWAELPLEPGLVKGAAVMKEAEVAAKIRQLFEAQKVKTKKVVLGFSGLHSMTRPIPLPSLPKAMLAEAVIRAARKALPIPLEQLYVSWQPIPAPAGKTQVFLVAIPRKTADGLVKTLRGAGLEPSHMALKPLVLTRAIKGARAIMVDVQPTEFDIVIMSDGAAHPVRTVSLPAGALTWQDKLPVIISDLDRTIKFFDSNNQEKPLDAKVPIYVSGDSANVPELQKALSDALGHPVVALASLLETPSQLDPGRCMVNIALAFKGVSPKKEVSVASLNVLPAPYQPKPISLTRIIALPGTVVAILLIAPLVMLMQSTSANIASISSELGNVNQMTRQRQLEQGELKKKIAELEKNVASAKASSNALNLALTSLDKQREEFNSNLRLTIDALPGAISLTGLNQDRDKLTIKGRASADVEVLSYAQSLELSGRFSEITVASMKRALGEEVDFSLVLKTKGGE